jgi:hypothetical protein
MEQKYMQVELDFYKSSDIDFEKTASSYRFEFTAPAGKELKYSVKEEKPEVFVTRIALHFANFYSI